MGAKSSGLPVPSRESGLAFKFIKLEEGNSSRSLRWKDYRPKPLKPDHLVCRFQVWS